MSTDRDSDSPRAMSSEPTLKTWSDWFRFARDQLGLRDQECVEYANLRFLEDENRSATKAADLRRESASPSDPNRRRAA